LKQVLDFHGISSILFPVSIKNIEDKLGEPGDLRDGVFVVIPDHDSILMVRHNYGEKKWSLPGGGVKQGEIVIHAARREMQEETGISRVITLRQVGQFTLIKRYGLVVLFEAIGWDGFPKADGQEIAECCFFNLDELGVVSSNVYPAQLKLVNIFLQYRKHPRPIYGKLTNPPIIEFEEQGIVEN